MTVLMTLRMTADGKQAEKHAAEDAGLYADTIEIAKRHGVISHRFYASETEMLVVDRWPSEDAFHAFFAEAGPTIKQIMAHSGASAEPEVRFWRELEIGDEIE